MLQEDDKDTTNSNSRHDLFTQVPISSHSSTNSKTVKSKKKNRITINMLDCKYDIVRHCSEKAGYKVAATPMDPWMVYWIDTGVSMERVMAMKPYQRINHFPGMSEICRKDNLARNLNRIAKILPKEYDFFPKTWILPAEYGNFMRSFKTKRQRVYIAKPDAGCQGKGIFLFKDPSVIHPEANLIIQKYVHKPFLINGFKFDLRVYVLITSCDPLRVFIYKEGLARFATEPYKEPSYSNMSNTCMHLTNYAINKHNENFDRFQGEDRGSKRFLSTTMQSLAKSGFNEEELWNKIKDVIIKTILTVQPNLSRIHRACFPNRTDISSSCFEILGFDIFFDHKLKPWVLEVNHSPSFNTDSPLDFQVKEALILDSFKLLNIRDADRKKFQKQQHKMAKMRLFKETAKSTSSENLEKVKKLMKSRDQQQIRNDLLVKLEQFEDSHMGQFERIYPTKDPVAQQRYDYMMLDCIVSKVENNANKSRREYIQQQHRENFRKVDLKKLIVLPSDEEEEEKQSRPYLPSNFRLNTAPVRNSATGKRGREFQQSAPRASVRSLSEHHLSIYKPKWQSLYASSKFLLDNGSSQSSSGSSSASKIDKLPRIDHVPKRQASGNSSRHFQVAEDCLANIPSNKIS